MFAVGGGPMPVLCGCTAALSPFLDVCLVVEAEALGLGEDGAAPYFSKSCCVELYLVAALSFSIVFVRSVCCSSRRLFTLPMRYA